jgi:hypothetical protein
VHGDRGANGPASHLDLPVQATHVSQQLTGDGFAFDINHRDRTDLVPQGGGSGGGQLLLGAASCTSEIRACSPLRGAGALGDQVVAAVKQQPP